MDIVPPKIHRGNASEWAMRTEKSHLIKILSADSDKFSLHV